MLSSRPLRTLKVVGRLSGLHELHAMSYAETAILSRVESLRRKLAGLSATDTSENHGFSTGCDALDRLLPGQALRSGMLVELLAEERGSGAGMLAMQLAKRAIDAAQGCLVVTDRWRRFYPPAAMAGGIETKDLIVVRSSDSKIMTAAEELWALDQALRCPGVSVVLAWLDKVDPLPFRRLQLAAESGKTLAVLLRLAQRAQACPTWSDVQLLVTPVTRAAASAQRNENRLCEVTLLRQRGRAGSHTLEGTSIELEIDETGTLKGRERRRETRAMHMVPRVAHPAARRRSAGA